MGDEITAASTVREVNGLRERAFHWLLLGGDRLQVALVLLAVIFAVLFAGILGGLFAVGPDSVAATAYGSGLISGTLTLTTIALSVNQLVLSRVLGSPNELVDRLDGTRELRDRVAELADEDAMPNDPAASSGRSRWRSPTTPRPWGRNSTPATGTRPRPSPPTSRTSSPTARTSRGNSRRRRAS